jgi:hypothetical protein
MHVDESSAKFETKRAEFWFSFISNTINKFLDVLTHEFTKCLPLFCNVDQNWGGAWVDTTI